MRIAAWLPRALCVALLFAARPAAGQAAPALKPAGNAPPAWTRRAVIYEVNVRHYTPEGTFKAATPHLARLRKLGVDIVWVMPIQPIGKASRKGGLGSPYSIANYTAVNPEYGTAADFKAFVREAHRQGIKVLLDWVPNHTAFDHAWITQHPDWYTRKPDGKISFPLGQDGKETDWTDVAELNYDNRAMRKQMIEDMRWWLRTMDIDGFRVDVAWGVPADFFADARAQLARSKRDLFWLAEAEGPELHANFDMSYGWELHHLMNEIAQGKKPTSALNQYLEKQRRTYPRNAYRMYFTSNHDENSWNGTEFERMGANHLPSYILSATLEGSMPLLYTGQEASLSKRLRFFEKDTVDWKGKSLADFYSRVFALKHSQAALANGEYGGPQRMLATDGGDRVYAFTRTRGANTVLVAVNFGDAPKTVKYQGLEKTGRYRDWFEKRIVPLAAAGSLEIPAHGYRVLVQ